MKVYILTDGLGWIVDRITDEMISRMPFEFTKDFYTHVSQAQFLEKANNHDLVHYMNWDIAKHMDNFHRIRVPMIISIRSFRYSEHIKGVVDKVNIHVINKGQLDFFPDATYIPDGIFDQFIPDHPFTVGFAGRPDGYKGYKLIEQACKELGVRFMPAIGNIAPERMVDYYKMIDLLVCASENEGMSTPVMECLAMNKPVLTTDVGIPYFLNVHKCSRNIEAIKAGISKFYTAPQVSEYRWDVICKQFEELYKSCVSI